MATITAKIGYYQRGEWDSSTNYDVLDVVRAVYSGSRYATYSSKKSGNKGNTPSADSNYWEVLSIDGETNSYYRLAISTQVFKTTTTSVAIGLQKVDGSTVSTETTLPSGWRVYVHCESGNLVSEKYYSTLPTIDPHSWQIVSIVLYDGDPTASGSTVQAIDQATLRLVSDGAKGDKGDDGSLTNYPIVECAGEIVLSDCYPNRIYKADSAITTLSVDVIYYSDGTNGTDFSAHGNIADEYVFDFIAGASCSVQLPEAVVWAATPSFSEGKRYIISIVDNLGLCAEYTI